MVIEVTSGNFEEEVLKADKPVVIDMWASWCGPCRMMSPVFEDLSAEMPGVKFVKVDVDNNSDLAQQYAVKSIPSFLVIKAGSVVKTMVGAQSKNSIKALIESVVG